jgi:putative transferase (TIGR04331 family)
MKNLVLNPKDIKKNKKFTNVLLGKWFLDFTKKKKFNYKLINKNNFNSKNEIRKYHINKRDYEILLKEIYPKLNKVHNVNWGIRSWRLFIGPWLESYVTVINDRINMIEPVFFKKKIAIKNYYLSGKNADLSSHNFKDFTTKSSLVEWNEKLFSRIIYLVISKKYTYNLNYQKKKFFDNYSDNKFFFENIINFIIKFLERILCYNNKFLFYKTYFNNFYKSFSILVKLRQFPFLYSLNLYKENLFKFNFNVSLRDKVKLNLKSKNLKNKILRLLITECLPTFYLEGFSVISKLKEKSFFPKKIKYVFTSNFYQDEIFKFWLAEQLNFETKLICAQHGAGYGFLNQHSFEDHEINLSDKYFTWGWKTKNKKVIPIGNFSVFTRKFSKNLNKKNILIILPMTTVFKRINMTHDINFISKNLIDTQEILNRADFNKIKNIDLKANSMTKFRRDLKHNELLKLKNNNIRFIDENLNIGKISKEYSLVIATYPATDFFHFLNLNEPSLAIIDERILKPSIKKLCKDLYKYGIIHNDGKSLINTVNKNIDNLKEWWNDKKIQSIKNRFCLKQSSNFDEGKLLNNLIKD